MVRLKKSPLVSGRDWKVIVSALEIYISQRDGVFFDGSSNCDGIKGREFKRVLAKINGGKR